ncbi:MAG: response regulator [Bacteroidales bacterium]
MHILVNSYGVKKRKKVKKVQASIEELDFAENIFNAVREPLLHLDSELKVVRASQSFFDFFKVSSEETIGKLIYEVGHQGKGSTFFFTIPYDPVNNINVENITNTRHNPEKKQIKNLKILVAEDDHTSQELIAIYIQPFGIEILNVVTGTEAVEVCRKNPDIDLIIMDIKMPEMDGYEATRRIRKFNKTVTIIAQTAFGLNGDRTKAISAGCSDYISKPISQDAFNKMIYTHFKSSV